ncbi:hypothetical protein QCA50_019188 [Cerrena zonata]|uniref:BTB domain-containing protein n=1 Tax=Cerrena zonata TaxID=2478898 RepID=A0AAW0FBI5_9APHY
MAVCAKAPFDHVAASVVLRTSDKVDFHVFKEILLVASPVFETIFSLPMTPTADNEKEFKGGIPIVVVEEDEECLDYLLRLCYPLPAPPSPISVSVAEKVLKAATKYEIKKVIGLVQSELISFGSSDPFRLYTFSCMLGFEYGAAHAARLLRTKYTPVEKGFARLISNVFRPTINESRFCELVDTIISNSPGSLLSPGCLFRLVRFICLGSYTSFCNQDGIKQGSYSQSNILFSNRDYTDAHIFTLYPHDAIIRSSDIVDFPVHRLILHISQTHWSQEDDLERVPVMRVQENSSVIRLLLYLCYNFADVPTEAFSPEEGIRLWTLAVKLGMEKIANQIKSFLLSFVDTNPLLVYFVASSCKWKDAAVHAAQRFALKGDPLMDGYIQEMDSFATLDAYKSLIQYYHRAAIAQYKIISDISPDLPSPRLGKQWYDMSLVRPVAIPAGLVLRLLADNKKSDNSDAHYIRSQSYDREPLAYGKHLAPVSASLNKILENVVSNVKFET